MVFECNSSSRAEAIQIAAELKGEKLAILPTDTLYALVADATSEYAVNKIFQLKKQVTGQLKRN